jgi:glutamate 5-kinase
MSLKLRKNLKIKNQRILIKLSSLAITNAEGGINEKQLKNITKDIAQLLSLKKLDIILVSSGAINAGKSFISPSKNTIISRLQAASAVGQPLIIQSFQKYFLKYGINIAQVLLTHEDIKSPSRSYNVKTSLETLLASGIIPIINENDTVSFDEITVGDNDQLSAMICEILSADTICMLTATDGLYNKDPKDKDAVHFPIIEFNDDFSGINLMSKSSAGRGGMKTKLQAVRKLTPLGVDVLISSFREKNPILRVLTSEVGSFFKGNKNSTHLKKKAWILTRVRGEAVIQIDEGAMVAIKKNASLLPIGISSVSGKFNRGDCIAIKYKSRVIAYGVSEYSNAEVFKIKSCKSGEIVSVLGQMPSKVVVHKNNLVLKED